jgi:uncharacterized membrane protein
LKREQRALVGAGVLLGMGLGGFVDGIVLHQILQWHHLVCTTATCHPVSIADLQRKNVQDGYFHLGVLVLTGVGVGALFRAGARPGVLWSGRSLFGAMLAGWGAFNLIEGLIDHHILQIHHVRPGPTQNLWDLAFLAGGVLLIAVGAGLIRSAAAERREA